MPSRISDRGRALAKAVRDNPELGRTLAEFSEPYGTISALSDIKDEPTNPMNYLYAMPVIGDAARFAGKGRKAMDLSKKNKMDTGENMKEWMGSNMQQRQQKVADKLRKEELTTKMLEDLDDMDPAEARALVLRMRDTDPEMFEALTKQDLGYTPHRKLEEAVDPDAAFNKMMGDQPTDLGLTRDIKASVKADVDGISEMNPSTKEELDALTDFLTEAKTKAGDPHYDPPMKDIEDYMNNLPEEAGMVSTDAWHGADADTGWLTDMIEMTNRSEGFDVGDIVTEMKETMDPKIWGSVLDGLEDKVLASRIRKALK